MNPTAHGNRWVQMTYRPGRRSALHRVGDLDRRRWAESVLATEVDGDGDTDILSASLDDDKIACYESEMNLSCNANRCACRLFGDAASP